MKVLIFHNYYQVEGGEDNVLTQEVNILKQNLVEVKVETLSNKNIQNIWHKVLIAICLPFSIIQYYRVKKIVKAYNPDVVHVHNYFPLFSPSLFFACRTEGVPIVHTLHNYRAMCPTATLMYEGKIVEKSINGASWWALPKRVYKNSFIGTLSLVLMVELHKSIGTWSTKVDRYIVLTNIAKQKYVKAGWPEHKLVIKPNFIEDPFLSKGLPEKLGGYALFVGRLSEEKGLRVLLESWKEIDYPLKIIGDGPLRSLIEKTNVKNVDYLGKKDKAGVIRLITDASFVVMPSVWDETFGMVIIEAFACGTPVIGSNLGGMLEIIENEVTGLHFEAGNTVDLQQKVKLLISSPEIAESMGENARTEYLAKYTHEENYKMLMEIYTSAQKDVLKRKVVRIN